MAGVVRRYAREDARPYTAHDFQDHYGDRWLAEWLVAPVELHVSTDRRAHPASWFQSRFGQQWQAQYQASAEAVQERLGVDGYTYNMQQFQQYYRNSWQWHWATSPELPCTICAPFAQQSLIAAQGSTTFRNETNMTNEIIV